METKMKVEIWSDIMCPFCYIGKRKFGAALDSFPQKDLVEVIWHSFQLNPALTHQPNKDVYTYLAELKGQTREWSVRVHQSVVNMAKNVGLDYRFDKAKVTNSFDAHRVIQLAKTHHLSSEIEERFFHAFFTEGALMSDHETLTRLAAEAGLDKEEVKSVLESDQYAAEVKQDGAKAQSLGASGVPFFLINNKYAISGAQSPAVFLETLTKAFTEWRERNPIPAVEIIEGQVCTPEGECK